MHQRDRQLATLGIWFVYVALVFIMFSQMLNFFQLDLTALWPPETSGYVNIPQSVQDLTNALTFAEGARESVVAAMRESLQQQMQARLPIMTLLILLATVAATLSTWFVWRHAGLEAHLALKALDVEKQKRRGRIERFVEELGADELVELRSRLVEDDGLVKPLGEIVEAERRVNGT